MLEYAGRVGLYITQFSRVKYDDKQKCVNDCCWIHGNQFEYCD